MSTPEVCLPGQPPMTLSQAAAHLGVPYASLRSRWYKGLRGQDLIPKRKSPRRPEPEVLLPGHPPMTLTQAAVAHGLEVPLMIARWRAGHRGADLVAPKHEVRKVPSPTKPSVHLPGHEPMTLAKAADLFGLSYSCVYARWNNGLRGEQLVAPKPAPKPRYVPKPRAGKVKSPFQLWLQELSEESGVPVRTLRDRYHRGLRGKYLLSGQMPKTVIRVGHQNPMTLQDVAVRYNLPYNIVVARACNGMRGDDLIAPCADAVPGVTTPYNP